MLWLQLQFLLCQQPTDALDIWFSLQTVVFSSPVLIDPMTRRIRDMSNNFEHFFCTWCWSVNALRSLAESGLDRDMRFNISNTLCEHIGLVSTAAVPCDLAAALLELPAEAKQVRLAAANRMARRPVEVHWQRAGGRISLAAER